MKMKNNILILTNLLLIMSCQVETVEFYVATDGSDFDTGTIDAPFATINHARNTVRKKIAGGYKGNIIISLRGGVYRLEETLIFGLEDSAPEGHTVRYKAYQDEEPVLTSTELISGWKKLTSFPSELPIVAQGNVWVANIENAKNWQFRTLFDGEKMLSRARSAGFVPTMECPAPSLAHRWQEMNTLGFPEGKLRNWDNLEDVEIFIRPTHQWLVNYLPIEKVDEQNGIATTSIPGTYRLCKVVKKDWDETCWVENVLEALDKPGEWVLNSKTGKLYYWPESGKPGDNISAPVVRELVLVEGKNVDVVEGDVPVRGLIFDGLTFTGGDRDVWTVEDRGIQHDWDMFDKDNALVRFRGAMDCAVTNCDLRNSGGSGIRVDLYGKDIEITNNKIFNLGGTGVLLCGYGPGNKDVNKGHLVQNNEIHHIGQLFWHSPAVFIWQSGENRILNNYIHDLPYDAVVLSGIRPRYFGIMDPVKWKGYAIPRSIRENMQVIRWDEVGDPQTAAEALVFAHARNNVVQDNEFHNVMETLGDGNAIYLSCGGTGNIIRRNLIYKSTNAANEIRFDDDQEESFVEENIIFGGGIKLKHTNYILNNVIIGGGLSIRPETAVGARVEHNIVYSTGNKIAFYSTNSESKLARLLDLARPDNNLFYSPDESSGRDDFARIQAAGHEKHGQFSNPLFVDLEKGDIRLRSDSPALDMGIKSIDIEKIGLLDEPSFKRFKHTKVSLY